MGFFDRFKKKFVSNETVKEKKSVSPKKKLNFSPKFSFQINKIDWKSIKNVKQLEASLRQLFTPKKYPGWFAFRFTANSFRYVHIVPFEFSLKNETKNNENDLNHHDKKNEVENQPKEKADQNSLEKKETILELESENKSKLVLEPPLKSEGPTSELVAAVDELAENKEIPLSKIASWGDIDYTENDLAEIKKAVNHLNLKHYHCTSLLGLFDTHLFEIEKPPVTQEEMPTAIRWKVKEMVEIPLEDMIIDTFDIIPPSSITSAATRAPQIFATVVNKNIVNEYFKRYSDANIPLEVIDIDELAQRNIANLFEQEKKGLVLLTFTEEGGLLTVSYNKELYFYRRLDISLEQLLQLKDADYEKRYKVLDRITTELQRSLDKVERQYSFISLNKIYVSPLPEEVGLENYLHSNLYISTETLNLSAKLDFGTIEHDQKDSFQLKFFHLIGACFRDSN